MNYAFINVASRNMLSSPSPLPAFLVGLAQTGPGSIEDLSWTAPNFHNEYVGKGYWVVQDIYPTPAAWQQNSSTPTYAVDAAQPLVTATYELETRPVDAVRTEKIAALANYRLNKAQLVVQQPVGMDLQVFINQCFAVEAQHKSAINALTTSEAISNYDFTTGWPS